MKSKKIFITFVASILKTSGIFIGISIVLGDEPSCIINLPISPVSADIQEIAQNYFQTTLSGVPLGYDVTNGKYIGYCVNNFAPLYWYMMPIQVMLYSSYCPPEHYKSDGWDNVNYILNNIDPSATSRDINIAIYHFVNFGVPFMDPPTAIANQMINDATANGDGFIPDPGQVIAVILDPIEPEETEEIWQDIIIEVPIGEGEGCTPGFWKNIRKHGDEWTGYTPNDYVGNIFTLPGDFNSLNVTLIEALNFKINYS